MDYIIPTLSKSIKKVRGEALPHPSPGFYRLGGYSYKRIVSTPSSPVAGLGSGLS